MYVGAVGGISLVVSLLWLMVDIAGMVAVSVTILTSEGGSQESWKERQTLLTKWIFAQIRYCR